MSGAASSSTMSRLQVLPQKSVNQRPTIALLSSSLDMVNSSMTVVEEERRVRLSLPEPYRRMRSHAPRFLRQYSKNCHAECGTREAEQRARLFGPVASGFRIKQPEDHRATGLAASEVKEQ